MLILPLGFSDCWFAPCRISAVAVEATPALTALGGAFSGGRARATVRAECCSTQTKQERTQGDPEAMSTKRIALAAAAGSTMLLTGCASWFQFEPPRRMISPAVPRSRTGSSISTMPAMPATSTTRSPTATCTVGASIGTRAKSTIRALPTLPRPTWLHIACSGQHARSCGWLGAHRRLFARLGHTQSQRYAHSVGKQRRRHVRDARLGLSRSLNSDPCVFQEAEVEHCAGLQGDRLRMRALRRHSGRLPRAQVRCPRRCGVHLPAEESGRFAARHAAPHARESPQAQLLAAT